MYTSEMRDNITKIGVLDRFMIGNLHYFIDPYTNPTISYYHITSLINFAFSRQDRLIHVSLPFLSYIGAYAFSKCTSLSWVYLMSTTLCTLEAIDVFSYCTALSYIYVPSTLLTSYKAATNWTTYSAKIYSYVDPYR